jgi:hypothetical protein
MKTTPAHIAALAGALSALCLQAACTFDAPDAADSGAPPAWTLGDSGPADASARDGSTALPDAAPLPDSGPADVRAPDAQATDAAGPADAAPDMAPPADAGPDAGDAGAPDMGPPTLTDCDGVMVDTENDPSNCGACGTQCDEGFGTCAQGRCGCALPELEVCRDDQRCLDLQRDPNNCGSCDFACAPGAACVGGNCECRPGLTLCNGECVDTKVDPNHCGGCGMDCGGEACRDWTCRERCDLLDFRCDQGAGGTACIEQPPSQGSHLHCYSVGQLTCGKECGGDQVCFDPPGFFNGLDCYDYRPARGCAECPCDDCTDDESCLDGNGLSGVAWCVTN